MANSQAFFMQQGDCSMDSGNTHSESAMMTSGIFRSAGGRFESDQYPVLTEQPGPENPPYAALPGTLELPIVMDHAELSRSPKRPLLDDDEHLRNPKHHMRTSCRDDLNNGGMSDWEEIWASEVADLTRFVAGDESVEADLPAPGGSVSNNRPILTNKGLLDNPYPRLFIVLPGSDPQKYHLHFLCEGVEGSDGFHEHDLRYLSDHEGYLLLRLHDFIEDYGQYVLHVMKAIQLRRSTMDPVYASRFQSGLKFIASRCIQQQAGRVDELSHDRLRHLQTFFDNKDPENFGLLYRIVLSNNDARWVCAEHYRHSYNVTLAKAFNTIVEINSGTFDIHKGIVSIALKTSVLRKEFIESFRLVTNVYELHLRLPWNTPLPDLNLLQAGLEQSSVVSLHLAFIPPQSVTEEAKFAKAKADIVAKIMCNRNLEKVSFSKLSHFLSSAAQVQGELTHLKVLALDTLDVSQENKKLSQEINELARLLEKCTQLQEFYLESLGESVAFDTLAKIYDGIDSSVQKLQLTTLKISCDQDSEVVFNYSRTEHDVMFTVDLVARSFEQQVFVQKFWSRIKKLRITSDIFDTEKKQFNYLKLFVKDAFSLTDLELSCPAGEFISTLQEVRRMFDVQIQAMSGKIKRPESCSLRLTDSQKYDYPTEENYLYTPNFIKQGVDGKYPSGSVSRQERQQQEISIHLPTKIAKRSFLKFAIDLVAAKLGRHLRSFTMPLKLEANGIVLLDKAVQSGPGLDVFSLAISSVKDDESWTHISHITKKSQEKQTPSEVKVALDLECGTGPQTDFVRNHLPAITSLWCTSPNLETWFQSLDDPSKDLGRLTELLLVFQYPQMAIKGQLLSRGDVQHMTLFLSRCVELRQLHLIDYPLDPLAWDTILEAINFETLTDISFTGSNFGAGQIYTFLKRISRPIAPIAPVEYDMPLITPCASGSGQPQGLLDKGKGVASDVVMTPVVQEPKKSAPLLSVTFSHLGMSETAKMELKHIVNRQPNLWHCSVQFQ